MIIVTETKNGSAFPKKAISYNDEAQFVSVIRETQLQHRSGDELVETVEQACAWLNETFAQSTSIITKEDFDNTESWSSVIDDCAYSIGWLALSREQQQRYEELTELMNERREFSLNNPGVNNTSDYEAQCEADREELAELDQIKLNHNAQ